MAERQEQCHMPSQTDMTAMKYCQNWCSQKKISIWRESILADDVKNHQLMDHAFNIWSRTFDIYFPRLVP